MRGARVAQSYYGMPGWCLHHNSDIWAMANPVGEGNARADLGQLADGAGRG